MKVYPSQRYHPDYAEPVTVHNEEQDARLAGWYQSPAEYGVETCPGRVPDPTILSKREAYLSAKAQIETPKSKPRRARA